MDENFKSAILHSLYDCKWKFEHFSEMTALEILESFIGLQVHTNALHAKHDNNYFGDDMSSHFPQHRPLFSCLCECKGKSQAANLYDRKSQVIYA